MDEKDNSKREKLISYMSDLMEDATDFSWQGAKAGHAVLCCELGRGSVSWNDVDRIDRIRRAHAQKYITASPRSKSLQVHGPSQNLREGHGSVSSIKTVHAVTTRTMKCPGSYISMCVRVSYKIILRKIL